MLNNPIPPTFLNPVKRADFRLGFPLKYAVIGVFWLLAGPDLLKAQEVKPLTSNPALLSADNFRSARFKRQEGDTLSLPFIDDFSYEGPFPNDSLWQDRQVYINRHMAIEPPTYGVATFDGIGADGRPYDPDRDNRNQALPTDTLTSTWIDLSTYRQGKDSVYLCFWYQEKGFGDAPSAVDSFTVQVKTQADTPQWKNIWHKNGQGELPKRGRAEGIVVLNLADADSNNRNFFFNGFQFRFLSYGNVSGNLDHWHLDYVTLTEDRVARNRNGNLSLFNQDVAVAEPPVSLLKEHRAIPWRQVKKEQLRDSFRIKASNADRDLVPVETGYLLEEEYTGYTVNNFDLRITANVDPFFGKTIFRQENQFDFLEVLGQDSLKVTFKPAVFLFGDDLKRNDTQAFTQYFNHYMAYDDGSPEAGFGIENFFRSAQVAQSFTLNKPDTLQAIGIRFNRALSNVQDQVFDVVVWSDLGPLDTKPSKATVERRLTAKSPIYDGRGHHNYGIYELEEPLPVNGRFYVGWEQSDSYFLNVGVDKNYQELFNGAQTSPPVFYNADGAWLRADRALLDSGVLTIRPYLGGEEEVRFLHKSPSPQPETSLDLRIYPNPAKTYLNLDFDQPDHQSLYHGQLLNQQGQVVKQFTFNQANSRLKVQMLPPGVYFLKIRAKGDKRQSTVRKVIIR